MSSWIRRCGIEALHEVPVYAARTRTTATFAASDRSALGLDNATIQWDRAVVAMSISDARAARNAPQLEVDGKQARFAPARDSAMQVRAAPSPGGDTDALQDHEP